MDGISLAHPDVVRGIIAGEWLRAGAVSSKLGEITLRPHQVDAARRIRALLARAGGALLCDEVGLGKTYVALAVARSHSRPLVVAPASLRDMWQAAAVKAGAGIRFLSAESLSRTLPSACDWDLVIVDEAHYFRTPSAKRYTSLAALTARAPVLLVSATPIHNERSDVTALLSLFLGSAARDLPDADRARYVVRRAQIGVGSSFPRVRDPVNLSIPHEPGRLDQLLALPPPTPARDGGLAAALATHTLVRLWASSDAALREGLRRRLAKTIAMRVALEEGRYPATEELRSWTYGDGAVQLGFASILSQDRLPGSDRLLCTVREHERALGELLESLPTQSITDAARVEHLRELRRRHAGTKIVAFSQFTDTVARLYRGTAPDGGVAMLTARGARIASGTISRAEALARFAPLATSAPAPSAGEAICLLIATDLLSEGVNLQDAAVVVHLDLPWTAATLEQRVGRVARMGSPHREIFIYAVTPPATSEHLLKAERIIRRKAGLAASSLGPSCMPPLFPPVALRAESDVENGEAIRRTLSRWSGPPAERTKSGIVCSAVAAECDAALVLISIGGDRRLLVVSNADVSPGLGAVRNLIEMAYGKPVTASGTHITGVISRARAWMESELAAYDAGRSPSGRSTLARRIGERLAQWMARCPRHERAVHSQRVAALQHRIQRPFTLGVERQIEEVLRNPAPDFLQQLERVIGEGRDTPIGEKAEVRAVLALQRGAAPSGNQRNPRSEMPEIRSEKARLAQ